MTETIRESAPGMPADERAELLARLRAEKRAAAAAGRLRPRDPGLELIPLSPAQERLYFQDLLDPGNPALNITVSIRVRGALDRGAVERALAVVVARHEALRTAFVAGPEGPRQRVVPAGPVTVPLGTVPADTDVNTDVNADADADVDVNADADLHADADAVADGRQGVSDLDAALLRHARTRLDLVTGRLLDAALFPVGDDEHLLQIVVHHIAFDGWSTSVLVAELVEAYRADTAGRRPKLEELPVQYPDFSLWARERSAGDRYERRLAAVRDRLTGAPFVLDLPADRPRPPLQTHHGALTPLVLDSETSERLAALARAEGTTPFVALLGVLSILLARASDDTEVVVGSAVAGRTRPELEPMIGCFADILVLRMAPAASATYRDLLRAAHEEAGRAYGDQEVPYAKVVEALAPPRDPSRNPLFQVMFGFHEVVPARFDDAVPEFTVETRDNGVTDFDLFLNMERRADGCFEGELRYNTDLFTAAAVADLTARFADVARAVAAAPDTPWERLAPARAGLVALAASFPVEPVLPVARAWARHAGLGLRFETPSEPGPVAAELRALTGVFGRNPGAAHVVLLRWEDLAAFGAVPDRRDPEAVGAALDRGLVEFRDALSAYRAWSEDPLTIVVCPPSAAWSRWQGTEVFDVPARRLKEACLRWPDVRIRTAEAVAPQHSESTESTESTGSAGSAGSAGGDGFDEDQDDTDFLDALDLVPYAGDDFHALLGASVVRGLLPLTVRDEDGRAAELVPVWPSRLAAGAAGPVDGADAAGTADGGPAAGTGAADPAGFREPVTDTERRLAAIWQEALKADRVGLDDSFFALGGHSFLAVELLTRIKAEFGRSVEPFELFRGPTLGHLAHLVDAAAPGGREDGPVPVSRDQPLAPSSTQRRLWTMAQVHGAGLLHNSAFPLRLDGDLDEAALRTAVAALLDRHESLRTTITEDGDGVPVLRIVPDATSWDSEAFPATTAVPEGPDRSAEIERLMRAAAEETFELDRGPLARFRLFAAGPRTHYLSMAMHHAVTDNRSWAVIVRDLAELYRAAVAGRTPELPELPVQFADYAHWQQDWLHGPGGREHEERWREIMRDVPAVSSLPTDFPRSGETGSDSGVVTRRVDTGLAARLRATGRRMEVPLFSVVLTAFHLLAARAGGRDEFVVGTLNGNREHPGLADVVGDFADLVPIRLTGAGDLTVAGRVAATHQAILDARAVQRLPFENIVSAVRAVRVPGRQPLFQTLFNFVDGDDGLPDLDGLSLTQLNWLRSGTEFELLFSLDAEGDEFLITLDYQTGLYSPAGAEALLDAFAAMLEAVAGDAEARSGDAGFPADCRIPAIAPGTGPDTGPDPAEAVPSLAVAASFTAEAAGPALGFWFDLFGRPARVAFAPYAQVVQQLLDPDAAFGTAGARVNAVLLRWEDWVRHLGHDPRALAATDGPARFDAVVRDLETAFGDLHAALLSHRAWSRTPLLIAVCPASPGWSAEPWATVGRGLTARLTRLAATLPDVRVLDVGPLADRYPVDRRDDEHADRLAHMPYTPEFTTVLATVLARAVLSDGPRPTLFLDPGRLLGLGDGAGTGDADSAALAARALRRAVAQGRSLVFAAGPATRQELGARPDLLPDPDTATWLTAPTPGTAAAASTPTDASEAGSGPVGGPEAGSVAVGGPEAGSVAVGGPEAGSVAVGDLGGGSVPTGHPQGGSPGAGGPEAAFVAAVEAGVVEPDGCVVLDPDAELCGRLSERFPGVLAVAVPGRAAGARQVLDHLWALDQPLFPGEYDAGNAPGTAATGRRVLAELSDAAGIQAAVDRARWRVYRGEYVEPRTERERRLAEILARLLGIDRVGLSDSFLALGGDSMTAIQVVSQAARHGISLSPRAVLEAASVADLAEADAAPVVVADQSPVVGPVALAPAQRWFFANPLGSGGDPNYYNHPYYLTLRPDVTADHLESALRVLVDHHDALRLRFARDADGEWHQWSEPTGVTVPFERVDLTPTPPAERAARAEALAIGLQSGLDLAAGPTMRALHLHTDGEQDRLLIICHHLIVDGMSRGLLLEDLTTLTEQAVTGAPLSLPPKTTSFRDWTERVGEYAAGEEILTEVPFWLEQVAPTPEGVRAPVVPVDHEGGSREMAYMETAEVRVSAEETAAVQRRTVGWRASLSDAVFAASAAVLSEWTGSDSCRFAVAGHGRPHRFPDLDLVRTVGWFQIYFPIRIDVTGAEGGSLVRSLHRQLAVVPDSGFGYAVLAGQHADPALRAGLTGGEQPLFSFNYMGESGFEQTSAHTSLFGHCPDSYGPCQDGACTWPYLFDLMPAIVDGALVLQIYYRRSIHDAATVMALAERIADRFRALAAAED
ncbi:condensation domain-containing protein [Streptomyces humi]|uniref:condensation domain-containing protein n=1 Tax=Streptomyces humi TaxID=1428620 RepID=UPI0006287717|nr:condensation domain-containing protein [Streptomyces humi]